MGFVTTKLSLPYPNGGSALTLHYGWHKFIPYETQGMFRVHLLELVLLHPGRRVITTKISNIHHLAEMLVY